MLCEVEDTRRGIRVDARTGVTQMLNNKTSLFIPQLTGNLESNGTIQWPLWVMCRVSLDSIRHWGVLEGPEGE